MQPKIILSSAYAARMGMSDVDLASLHDMDLLRVVPASENNTCPQCGNHADDSYVQLLTYEPAATPERVSGRRIVWCLCEAMYSYAFVHEMAAQQPLGEAHVRAASAASPRLTPPTGTLTITGERGEVVVLREELSIGVIRGSSATPSGEAFGTPTLS